MAEIKFCGLTRPEDAAAAAEAGAAFLGVIFAGGPRHLEADRARVVLDASAGPARRVGVFGSQAPADMLRVAGRAGVHVLQLHGDPGPAAVAWLRAESGREVWAVARLVPGEPLPARVAELLEIADAVVIDTHVPGRLGGTGVALDWAALDAEALARGTARIVLAGGLTPGNVAAAIIAIRPHVVDVSSGVESGPGVKNHALLRDFARAVHELRSSSHERIRDH